MGSFSLLGLRGYKCFCATLFFQHHPFLDHKATLILCVSPPPPQQFDSSILSTSQFCLCLIHDCSSATNALWPGVKGCWPIISVGSTHTLGPLTLPGVKHSRLAGLRVRRMSREFPSVICTQNADTCFVADSQVPEEQWLSESLYERLAGHWLFTRSYDQTGGLAPFLVRHPSAAVVL